MTAANAIEHLVGMQAQNPRDPYYGLAARLEGFRPGELVDLLSKRNAVRAQLMRGTIHLVTATDCLTIGPIFQSVLARTFGSTAFNKNTAGVDRVALLALGRKLLEEKPRTRAQLGPLLADVWPASEAASLAQAVTYLTPIVQVTPRGLWEETGPAAWTTVEKWLGRELPDPSLPDELILRYLAAFGPSQVKDIRVWSGLAGIAAVVERLKPQLRTFHNETGSALLDLPDAPRPDPDTPAPPRFLPEYDNLLLAHADRSRFFDPDCYPRGFEGNLLFDGVFAGGWKIARTGDQVRLNVELLRKVPKQGHTDVQAEGKRLLEFTDPYANDKDVLVAEA